MVQQLASFMQVAFEKLVIDSTLVKASSAHIGPATPAFGRQRRSGSRYHRDLGFDLTSLGKNTVLQSSASSHRV